MSDVVSKWIAFESVTYKTQANNFIVEPRLTLYNRLTQCHMHNLIIRIMKDRINTKYLLLVKVALMTI
jgi:hypothetical protein